MSIWMLLLGIAFTGVAVWLALAGQGRPKEEQRGWNAALVILVVMATGVAILLGYQ
jgi:hypothetical protein